MRKTALENWICEIEALPELTREGLEALQLQRLNETLNRVKNRSGFYRDYPKKLDNLKQLQTLPFTTAADLSACPGKFLLTSQSEVSRVISGATSGTTGPAKRVFYTAMDMHIRVPGKQFPQTPLQLIIGAANNAQFCI